VSSWSSKLERLGILEDGVVATVLTAMFIASGAQFETQCERD
jgi:hypothetical protein